MKGKQKISGSSLADNDQIMDQPTHQVSLAEFQKKYRTRKEVWQFVAMEMDVYCPEYEQCTSYFLADLACGVKHRKCHQFNIFNSTLNIAFFNDEVKIIRVP